MKYLIPAVAICLTISSFTSNATAQYDPYSSPEAAILAFQQEQDAYNRQFHALLEQQMDQSERLMQNAIDEHRRQTGDYQTPDHELRRQLEAAYYAQNPQAALQQARIFQETLNQNQRAFEAIQGGIVETNNSISRTIQSSDQYWNSTRSDLSQQRSDVMRGTTDFTNPDTGQSWNLPAYDPGFSTNGMESFLQNDSGQYFQVDSLGYGTELYHDR
ncbi:MAG: hypothetical protein AAF456_18230 [Planctomycetota bacterium]